MPWAIEQLQDGSMRNGPTLYVPGNHDGYREPSIEHAERKAQRLATGSNMHFLNPGKCVLAGVRFVGADLWTNLELFGAANRDKAMAAAAAGMNDYRLIRTIGHSHPTKPTDRVKYTRLFAPADALARHQRGLEFIRDTLETPFDGPTVVASHTGPTERSAPERFSNDPLSPAFSSRLSFLIERYQPSLWIHGHTHESVDYNVGNTRVVCNPAGYQHEPNPNFTWDFVIDIPRHDHEPTVSGGLGWGCDVQAGRDAQGGAVSRGHRDGPSP